MKQRILIGGVLALLAALALTLLRGPEDAPAGRDLDEIRAAGELVVLTRNAPTSVYVGRDGREGLEHDLVQAFARHLGVSVRYEFRDTVPALLEALATGEGDLVAAGITRTPGRAERFAFGPDYLAVEPMLVCHRRSRAPDTLAGLPGSTLVVPGGTSYVARLDRLATRMPELDFEIRRDTSTERLLQAVAENGDFCTAADSTILAMNRRVLPELEGVLALGEPQAWAWPLPRASTALRARLEEWFTGLRESGELRRIRDHYFATTDLFNFVDLRTLHRHIDERLPRYRAIFEDAAKANDLPWSLLAAQAYQESHWNPRAESPTGVRGLMMLTRPTAASVGVEDRTDPEQSIRGGARYLRRMIERLPDSVHPDDRDRFALAAYNVGMGHIHDAQTLARRLGRDPGRWRAIAETLPLLTEKRYYRELKYGYARGIEPVRYVQRIREYEQILLGRLREPGG